MAIKFTCESCRKAYSLSDAQAGKKARCTCGKVMLIPAPAPVERDPLDDLMPDEPVERLPAAAQRVFEQPGMYASGFQPAETRKGPPVLTPSPSGRSAPVPGTPYKAPRDGISPTKKIVSAVCGVLVLLGAAARIFRAVDRATDGAVSSAVSSTTSKSLGAPPPIAPITPPARQALTPHGMYVSASLQVQNCAGSTTNIEVMLPPGKHAKSSLPCVFVAPAGSSLLTGNELEDNYTKESLPYVESGFAVVRYSLAGVLTAPLETATVNQILPAYTKFRAAHGGVSDASAAIDTVIADYPEIDPNRLYVAGHSSAATAAMLVAQKDTRIKACVAYAPAIDLRERFGEGWSELESNLPNFVEFIKDTSPSEQGPPRGPVMLFHARDDSNVPVSGSQRYAGQYPGKVKLITVPTGDHYDSMINAGIPAGIAFLTNDMHAKG